MTCVICRQGETTPGETTITLERGATTLVVKAVPAEVCNNCGEAYVDETAAGTLLAAIEEAERKGIDVEVRRYAA